MFIMVVFFSSSSNFLMTVDDVGLCVYQSLLTVISINVYLMIYLNCIHDLNE